MNPRFLELKIDSSFFLFSENETSRNGRWMFGRTITFVMDLIVASLMANIRTKEKVNRINDEISMKRYLI